MRRFMRELFEALSSRNRRLPPEKEEEIRRSQHETLRVLEAVATEAQDQEALHFAKRREREMKRLEHEYDLYRIERER